MDGWLQLIIVVSAGSLLSLVGGLYMVYGKWGTRSLQRVAVPFAAGALLAAAFVGLLPEALHDGPSDSILALVLIGFLAFFVLERSFGWFHHHYDETNGPRNHRRTVALIIISDITHNFIDGLAIGAAFLISPVTGLVATIAAVAHEIPQEIGDFGLLLERGMKKRRVVIVNLASSLATVIAALIVFGFGTNFAIPQAGLMAITAGFFIYIAASDIIPTIHAEPERKVALKQTIILLIGVILVSAITVVAHDYLPHS